VEEARVFVEEALAIVEPVRDEEQEAFDNMPDGLQQSERGQAAEQAASELDDAVDSLESVLSNIETALQ